MKLLRSSSPKATGLPEVLQFVLSFIENLPNLESVTVARGQSLGEKVSRTLVRCLTSSKADTRNKAEAILALCVKVRVVATEQLYQVLHRLSCFVSLTHYRLSRGTEQCIGFGPNQVVHRTYEACTAAQR